jgi:hypothetical protein
VNYPGDYKSLNCKALLPRRHAQHRIPADAAARPKIGGILETDFMLTLVLTYWCGAAEC